VGKNKEGKTEPLEQCGRNAVSPKETSQEKLVVCNQLEANAVQKESIKPKTVGRSLSSCERPDDISNPTELMSNKHVLEKEQQKTCKDSQELDSVCNSQSLVLPVITKSSPLQVIAKRQKSLSTWYWGLDGIFAGGANPKQAMLEAHSSLCAASSPVDSTIPLSGDGQWVSERSLSEYADDSLVQGVLESQLNRPLSGFNAQSRTSLL
ncbi:hypothetical protein N310_08942, partial [Acanthisitta chloris]